MSIDKIRGNDPHEPGGSERKLRDVGDQYKRIERTGEVDPENRKKQKWETPNDSPMDLPKKTSSLGASGPSAPADPYDSYANKSSNPSQNSSNNSSNSSNPYTSQNSQNRQNTTSSNQQSSSNDSSKNEKTPDDKQNEKTTDKKSDSKDDKKLPGTLIEGDELVFESKQTPHPKAPEIKAQPIHAKEADKAPKEPHDPHAAKKEAKETVSKEHPHTSAHDHKAHHEKAAEKAPIQTGTHEKDKTHTEAQTHAKEVDPKAHAKHKEKKGPISPSDKAPTPTDLGQKAPEPTAIPQATNISGPAPLAHGVSSQLSHPEISRLFTQLVSHLTATASKGVKEVTITLSSGTFKGSQIIITESSTALRNYNIQLLGATNEASSLFAAHASELMESFQSKPFPFKVNRIDPGHLIRRKEDIGKEDNNDENQESS